MQPDLQNNYSIIWLFKVNMIIGNSFVSQGDFKELILQDPSYGVWQTASWGPISLGLNEPNKPTNRITAALIQLL